MSQSDEHERTMAFADIAFGQIKALRQPAIPRNFEIWYNYATGYNPSLNQTVNEALERQGTLTTKDLDDIYDTFLSPHRLTDRVDAVGAKVVDEIEQVMAMIDAAADTTTGYTESLVDASQKLGGANDRDGLRAIVESLVSSTREIEETNSSLEGACSPQAGDHAAQEHLEAVATRA